MRAVRAFGVIDVSDDGATKFSWVAIHDGDRWQVISQTFSAIPQADEE